MISTCIRKIWARFSLTRKLAEEEGDGVSCLGGGQPGAMLGALGPSIRVRLAGSEGTETHLLTLTTVRPEPGSCLAL